jgi:NAD(P)-dependent dehydrogenase (short-subunit alcohol dehydrogenase family)
MANSLEGASVVVLGGSSGMGLATAKMAREAGARITIAGRDAERLDAAATELGGDVATVSVDVADENAVAKMFDELERVDHVATLAGAAVYGRITELEVADMHRPMDVRLWGSIHVAKHAAPRMNGGSITFCSGVAAEQPVSGRAIGTATTAAAEALGRALALELAPIRVNTVRPGAIDTPMLKRAMGDRYDELIAAEAQRLPAGRVGEPDDIARAIVFFMTSPFITGVTLTVDGGHLLT